MIKVKKITSYITSIFCVFIISISLVYAYSTDIYDIDILDGFYKAENNDYWQKEGEDSSLSILIYTEKNKNNLDLSSYSEDDIDEEEAEKSAYFIQQGMLFPVLKNDKSIFLMPQIVQDILGGKNDIEYRRIIKNNSEIISQAIK